MEPRHRWWCRWLKLNLGATLDQLDVVYHTFRGFPFLLARYVSKLPTSPRFMGGQGTPRTEPCCQLILVESGWLD